MAINNRKRIAVFGAGGFGREVADLICQINCHTSEWEMVGFFDDGEAKGNLVNGHPILGGKEELNKYEDDIHVVLALGDPGSKKKVFEQINNPRVKYPILIHPSVIMGDREFIRIGEGVIICAGNIITTNISIGNHVIINLTCTIGHDTKIGNFSSFMPGCNISGEVHVGEYTFFGTGSKIINRVRVGSNCVIGAGAVVISDIINNATAVGVPAKVVKMG